MKYQLAAYYKGTVWPSVTINKKNEIEMWEKKGNEMIEVHLRSGESLTSIGTEFKNQLDIIEQLIFKYSPNGISDHKTCERVSEELGESPEFVRVLWYTNIAVLLKLKVIQDDNMNGWLNMKIQEPK